MDKLIRTTTEHFLGMLDDQREFFSLDELVEAGLPEFLVKRMQLELMRNLQDSVTPPQSDWADMSTEAVRKAWGRFLEAIHEEIRLPASFSSSVIESSTTDILELLVTPRAFLPEYIFGSESRLDLQSIRQRCEWVVVYTYFANALPRFMEKKGRASLTKEQADRIIERLDERVTSHYTSLNWAQLFEPWFQLLGEKVEPGLFASFFRDKGKPGVARLFDSEKEPIQRTRLIEILSKPQLDDIDEEFEDVGGELIDGPVPESVIDLTEADEQDEQSATDDASDSGKEQASKAKLKPEPRKDSETKTEPAGDADSSKEPAQTGNSEAEQKTAAKEEQDSKKEPESKKEQDSKKESEPKKEQDSKKEPESKAETEKESRKQTEKQSEDGAKPEASDEKTQKKQQAESTPEEKNKKTEDEEDANLVAHYQKTNGNDKHDPPLISVLKKDPDDEEEEDSAPLYSKLKQEPEDDDADDVPIWQKFTSEDDGDTGEDDSAQSDVEKKEEAAPGAVSPEEVEKVRSYAKDMEKEFVEELFGGDEDAFVEAIEHITRLSSWKEAGSYISREVFDRNQIDIYSDTAIYFTDRMQTYFLERE